MKNRTKIILFVIASVVVVIYIPLKLYAGKSIRFFLDSGLRAPFNVKVLESGNRGGRDGECIFIFDTDDLTIKNYLSKTPWDSIKWQKGPVPRKAFEWTDELSDYESELPRSNVWYMHQQPIRPRHDEGRLIIIDESKKRVYFSFWWW